MRLKVPIKQLNHHWRRAFKNDIAVFIDSTIQRPLKKVIPLPPCPFFSLLVMGEEDCSLKGF